MSRSPRGAVTVLLVALGAASLALAMPPVVMETHVVVRVDALTVGDGPPEATGVSGTAEVGPASRQTITLRVPWGAGTEAVDVSVKLAIRSIDPSGEVTLSCASSSSRTGRPAITAARELLLGDEGSGLFEVFGEGGRRILLTLHGETVQRPVVQTYATPGDPVRFKIAVEGVEGERSAVLETNEVHSFVGQSVEYSFQAGPSEGREVIRLVLLPVAITGDMITIQADVSGVLPGADGPAMLSRSEHIVATRGSTSAVVATVGTPPAGYRFQVTPDF